MKKILLIEDERIMRENLVTLLELEAFDVVAADNGTTGLALARAHRPDLILCDITMPGLDGHGVLRALRDDDATADVPFIFLTARGEKPDLRAGMNLGADDYLIKPAGRTELLAAIQARLERHACVRPPARSKPDFGSATPLESLGLTPREAEVLLWLAQGKGNAEIGTILGCSEATAKRHVLHIFEKLGVETRTTAALRAIETLGRMDS